MFSIAVVWDTYHVDLLSQLSIQIRLFKGLALYPGGPSKETKRMRIVRTDPLWDTQPPASPVLGHNLCLGNHRDAYEICTKSATPTHAPLQANKLSSP